LLILFFFLLAFCLQLPISRLQRDLSDSTVIRGVGVPLAHGLVAFKSIEKGLGRLDICSDTILADLNKDWSIITGK
jgi:adenylosuccinate lyase